VTGWLVGRLIADRRTLLSGMLIANRLSAEPDKSCPASLAAVAAFGGLSADGLTDWQPDDADGQPKMFLSR
jgi:hypothetical protein